VFGLGNRQYEHFNSAAKSLDAALPALGAARLLPVGLGDDDGTLEEDYAAWRSALWEALERAFPGVAAGGDAAADAARRASADVAAAVPAYECALLPPHGAHAAPPPGAAPGGGGAPGAYDARRPLLARLLARRELQAPASGRSTVHLELELAGSGVSYEAGDHLGVAPENAPDAVAAAAKALGLDAATLFSLKINGSLPEPFPTPCTLATALRHYADVTSPPRRGALAALAAHASDPSHRARLTHLASPAGKDDYAAFITAPARSLLEVMAAFPSAKPPLGVFFGAVAPRLAVRYYSISSSPRAPQASGRVHITVAVVSGASPTGRLHQGVASTWLAARVPIGGRVPIFVRTSAFRLPRAPGAPLVMIGPGTGLAPFRGFIQERAALAAEGAGAAGGAGGALGAASLFFGCRAPGVDDIYADELAAALKPPPRTPPRSSRSTAAASSASSASPTPPLSELHLCYSRAPGLPKRYVQAALAEQAAGVWAALSAGGCVYVCGDARGMAKDVHKALLECVLRGCGGMSAPQAEAFAAALAKEGRYQRDVW
jgi:NADPH-ferrihemoprotein reductase